ncbi:MAG: hypothetical protein AMXMBFR36_21380 [Acidobacteriota bacterium]
MQNDLNEAPAVLSALRKFLSVGTTGSEAAEALDLFVAATKLLPLRNLEAWEHAVRAELWVAEQNQSRTLWKQWVRPHRFASWLDLCSHDGRKRESALRDTSGGAPSPFLFALALRRLNDWVPQVRTAARETLPRVASNSKPQDVAAALWSLLTHWNTWGRMESADRDVVLGLTAIDAVACALRHKILSATAGAAAQVLSQCVRSPTFDQWIGEFAKDAAQPAVRARAFRWLLDGRAAWTIGRKWKWTDLKWCRGRFEPVFEYRPIAANQAFLVTLNAAIADKSAVVRRVAAEFVIREVRSLGENASLFARQLSSDASPSVAERGHFALKLLDAQG